MGISSNKPKRLEEVELPAELAAFLKEVNGKIERREEDAMIESDDLLQCERTFGGRIEEGGDEWGFTYRDGAGARWELVFSAAELGAIERGLRRVKLYVCVDSGCGNKFSWREYGCPKCDR